MVKTEFFKKRIKGKLRDYCSIIDWCRGEHVGAKVTIYQLTIVERNHDTWNYSENVQWVLHEPCLGRLVSGQVYPDHLSYGWNLSNLTSFFFSSNNHWKILYIMPPTCLKKKKNSQTVTWVFSKSLLRKMPNNKSGQCVRLILLNFALRLHSALVNATVTIALEVGIIK